jgi:signal peptidase I
LPDDPSVSAAALEDLGPLVIEEPPAPTGYDTPPPVEEPAPPTHDESAPLPTRVPGQHLLARRPLAGRSLGRGDIVVVDSAELGRPIIKRVVGLPGEHVEVDADGRVRVDWRDLPEPYVVHHGGMPRRFEVPLGHLLLLGDNRAASSDARRWREPFVPVSAVRGRVRRPGRPPRAADPGRGSRRSAAAPIG